MAIQKYTFEQKIKIGKEVYEELIKTKYDRNVILKASCKYGYAESMINSLVRTYRKSVIDPKPTPEQELLFTKYRSDFIKGQTAKVREETKDETPILAKKIIDEYLESEDIFPYFIALKYYKQANNFPAALQKMKNGSEDDIIYYSAYRSALARKKQEFSELLLKLTDQIRNGQDINGKHIPFVPFDFYDQYKIKFVKFKSFINSLYLTRLKNETLLTSEDFGLIQKFIVKCEMNKSQFNGDLDRIVSSKYYCDGVESTPDEVQQIMEYLTEKNIPLNSYTVSTCFERMKRGLLRRPEKTI